MRCSGLEDGGRPWLCGTAMTGWASTAPHPDGKRKHTHTHTHNTTEHTTAGNMNDDKSGSLSHGTWIESHRRWVLGKLDLNKNEEWGRI
mmetsp:Transcript_19187/g.28787  ORF Transcript_19187/g.28787 Transcript_19187/m.28787 type:complete len:89 (+) Transcript_19187:258-524(+)